MQPALNVLQVPHFVVQITLEHRFHIGPGKSPRG
jgi:hypothetical protein